MKKSDKARFFGKNLVWPKLGKKGPKMDCLQFFLKIESKVLSGNSLKRSVLFLSNFWRKLLHVQKKSGSRDIMEKLSTNQFARFCKLLYLLNRLTVFCNFCCMKIYHKGKKLSIFWRCC